MGTTNENNISDPRTNKEAHSAQLDMIWKIGVNTWISHTEYNSKNKGN